MSYNVPEKGICCLTELATRPLNSFRKLLRGIAPGSCGKDFVFFQQASNGSKRNDCTFANAQLAELLHYWKDVVSKWIMEKQELAATIAR